MLKHDCKIHVPICLPQAEILSVTTPHHRELSEKAFTSKHQKWYKKRGYNFSEDKALDIYAYAHEHFGVVPKTTTLKLLTEQAASQLPGRSLLLWRLPKTKMLSLAASLPEYFQARLCRSTQNAVPSDVHNAPADEPELQFMNKNVPKASATAST